MEIPSLIILALSSLCRQLSPQDRPIMHQTLKGIFDKHNYSAIFRAFDEMDYCIHCDVWVSGPALGKDTYHMIVSHSNLLSNCDCNECKRADWIRTLPRIILCVRCKGTYHSKGWPTDLLDGGINCDIDPWANDREPHHLCGGYDSNFDNNTFILTHRAPSYIMEWTRDIAKEKYERYSALRGQGGSRGRGISGHSQSMSRPEPRKKRPPIRGGHALCDGCADEMLLTGQLRWVDQGFDLGIPHFNPAFCEGCCRGFPIGNTYPGVHTIVVRKEDSVCRFGNDHIVDYGPSECAFYRYEHYDRTYVTTIYIPKLGFDRNPAITKYQELGMLICDECFEQIEPDLEIVHTKREVN